MKKVLLLIIFYAAFTGKGVAQFTATLTGLPLITTGWNIGGYSTVVDSTVQLTTFGPNENGYVYYDSAVDLTACAKFNVKFDYQIGPGGGLGVADGIAFFYIATPPSGFITGGGLGLPTPVSGMVFTLDTWDNDGDGLNPESQLFGYTTSSTYSEANRSQMITGIRGGETFMDDNTWHHCEIDYNAGNINVYYDYSPIAGMTGYYLITIPSGYFGFSSSTGGGYSVQSIKEVFITANGISVAPTVTSPVTYCLNSTAVPLTATGAGPFSWFTTDTATVVSLPGAPTPSTTTAGTTTYYVRQGLGPCISVPDSIKVIVNPLPPPPVIGGVSTYCTGQPFVPFTVTGSSILWYTAAVGGVGSTTPLVVNTSVGGVTTVWASQTVAGCEGPRASFSVTVHITPVPPVVSGTSVYCQFEPYVPPTATGTNILWYTAPTGGFGTLLPPTINTAVAGTYIIYATQSDSGCESPRGPFTIIVHPKPVPPVITDNPSNYCPGQPFVPFYIVSGANVLWYTAPTGGVGSGVAPTVNTGIPGTYTQWASQTIFGCESDRVPVVVTVYDSVTSGFNYTVKWGCTADTVIFDNTSRYTTNYLWWFGDLHNSLLTNPTHVYLVQAIDTVKLYSSTATCIDSSIQYIDLRHPLHAAFTVDTDLICQGNMITFSDSSMGTGPVKYLWNFGDGFTDNTAGIIHTHTYHEAGVLNAYVVISDSIPCTDTMFKKIYVDTISGIQMSVTDTTICRQTYVTFTGYYASLGNTGVTWNFGNGDIVKNQNPVEYGFDNAGQFTITATANYRVCPEPTVSRKVTVIPQPIVDLGPDTAICLGGAAILLKDNINAGNSHASWLWSNGSTSAGISVVEPGVYSLVVKIDGCKASGAVKVSNDCYMNVPNAFTPNGDGSNDYFYPRDYLAKGLISFKMDIYNRWGELIFETTALEGSGWDGRFNNVPQPEGVYVYVIDGTFKDGQHEHHQGNVTLLR